MLQPTSGPDHARLLAAQAVRDGFETIVAAGGDGTVNEVLNGIGDVPGGFDRVRLGVLPFGTVNVFARELGLPVKFTPAWEVIRRGKEMRIDLPVAEFTVGGKLQKRYFIQLGGAGVDSRAIELVNWNLKKLFGPLAYVFSGLRALNEVHPMITVEETLGQQQAIEGQLVLLGNGRFYGGSFAFFPKATLTNGLIEACVFPKFGWRQIFKLGWGLLTKKVHESCGVVQLSAPSFTLRSSHRVLLELDGENVGELPAKISVRPRALRVVTV